LPDGNGITSKVFPDLQLPLVIQQKTPLRVVHRRSNLLRERQILQLVAKGVDGHHFRLELSTQASIRFFETDDTEMICGMKEANLRYKVDLGLT
jgi:hypothetical protein